MNRWKSILLFVVVITSVVQVSAQRNELSWSEDKPLTWNDFKKRVGNGGYYKAYTYSGIRYTVDEKDRHIVIEVQSYFMKNESWVFSKSMRSSLLSHEQLHFDITELFARKMRREFEQYEVHIDKFFARVMMAEVKRVFNNLYSEMEAAQKKYDKETNHSIDKAQQREWTEWIKNELDSLAEYAL